MSWDWIDEWAYTDKFHQFTGDGCTVLSLMLVIACIITATRTLFVVRQIDKMEVWYSQCGCKDSIKSVLYGFVFLMAILGSMKLWSVTDVIYSSWLIMPHEYHIRAYVYLTENFGVVIMAWVVTSYLKRVAFCAERPRKYIGEVHINPAPKKVTFIGMCKNLLRGKS